MSSRETFDRYAATWGTLDLAQVAPFYGFPCLFASPAIHVVANGPDDLSGVLSQMIEGLKSSDYARSELADVKVQALAATLEQVSCTVTRLNRSGEAFARMSAIYFWRRDGNEWRLIATIAGDPP